MVTRIWLLLVSVIPVAAWCQEPEVEGGLGQFNAGQQFSNLVSDGFAGLDSGQPAATLSEGAESLWPSEKPAEETAGILDFGGSYRARYHRETNMRPGSSGGLSGVDDSFWLHQTRLWMEGRLNRQVEFRLGFMDAASFGHDFLPRGNEVNRHDLYQAYVDLSLEDCLESGTLKTRVGRQEIRLGSARLMMAPGWANRRRSHDGVRFIWNSNDWETSSFWVRPALRNRTSFSRFDIPDPDQQIYGVFSTYQPEDTRKWEVYWLAYDLSVSSGGARYDTFGTRLLGDLSAFSYEAEAGVQLGANPDDTDHQAGFFTGGVGRKFEG
ncbi:MAG: alginate export family protein, partial [Planctomycetota bacterium]|nr:alginate export family protein [Planctomycetota bacterium]